MASTEDIPEAKTAAKKGKRPAESATGGEGQPKKSRPKKKKAKGGVLAEALAGGAPPPDEEKEAGSEEDDDNVAVDLFNNPLEEAHRARLSEVVKTFTPEEEKRFQCYFRSKFPAPVVKRLMASQAGSAVNQTIGFIMCGIAKVFVGELVETARIVQGEWGEGSYEVPVLPKHYREAYRRLRSQKKIPCLESGQLGLWGRE
mmetsp:Transcript_28805/g.66556  ORF Transcript_28805/g.66556 Transcript_28805/m.66556 type:complete len:201 (-) Transcript_28805:83-685(-)